MHKNDDGKTRTAILVVHHHSHNQHPPQTLPMTAPCPTFVPTLPNAPMPVAIASIGLAPNPASDKMAVSVPGVKRPLPFKRTPTNKRNLLKRHSNDSASKMNDSRNSRNNAIKCYWRKKPKCGNCIMEILLLLLTVLIIQLKKTTTNGKMPRTENQRSQGKPLRERPVPIAAVINEEVVVGDPFWPFSAVKIWAETTTPMMTTTITAVSNPMGRN